MCSFPLRLKYLPRQVRFENEDSFQCLFSCPQNTHVYPHTHTYHIIPREIFQSPTWKTSGNFVDFRLFALSAHNARSSDRSSVSFQFLAPLWLLSKSITHQIRCLANAVFHYGKHKHQNNYEDSDIHSGGANIIASLIWGILNSAAVWMSSSYAEGYC